MTLETVEAEIVADVKAIPEVVESEFGKIFDAGYAAAKPILEEVVTSFEADITTNAGNTAVLLSTAVAIATAAIPKLVAAEITAAGTTVLAWVSNMLTSHPAVVAATAPVVTA